MDYVTSYRQADTVASDFNEVMALLGLGLEDERFRALPRTGPDGEPLVVLTVEAVQLCVAVLVALAECL
ncbi:hypothetical protein [Streptantibioticus ferralitis]|uniref:Uncharacterized protein n=1 Tax=Streptantibioticus ferralitis TaxID=236510 RepID=A0ABT5Z9P0_9ACTN|nr:hypothetical protein [Streptantibioticus ferralitis]MDF2260539.1 hypothetical protein [Streptantibioticus ferralitis]